MADEPIIAPVAEIVAAPAPEPIPTPEPASVEAAPVVETPAAVEPVPSPESPAALPIPETPASILEGAKVDVVPPEPAKVEDEPVPVEAPPPVEAPAPTYETLKLPEGIQMPAEELTRFTEVLGENKIAPEAGQKLLEAYTSEIQRFQQDTLKNQTEAFNTVRRGWVEEFKASDIGGNQQNTTIRNCAAVLEQYGSPELRTMLTFTGAGDHPAMIRFINNIGKVLGEPRPIAAAKPPAAPVSKAQRRYAGGST